MKIDNWEKEFDDKFGSIKHREFPQKALKAFIRDTVFWTKIDAEMNESVKRYEQAKQDGTLDKHFPAF